MDTGIIQGVRHTGVGLPAAVGVAAAAAPAGAGGGGGGEEEAGGGDGLVGGAWRVEGVQFHPESILTVEGKNLLKNFLEL